MAKHALTGGDVDICVDKASGLGVIVAGLEVVERGFGVVNITPVAERVLCAQGARERAGAGKLLAPAIVSIFYYGVVAAVNQADDVALPIADIVVICSIVIDRNDIAACIIAKQQRIVTRDLRNQDRTVVVVIRYNTINGLLGTNSVLVAGLSPKSAFCPPI